MSIPFGNEVVYAGATARMLGNQVLNWQPPNDRLKQLIGEIVMCGDVEYDRRYPLVFEAVAEALKRGLDAGFRIDFNEPDWPVAYIELPTGQVSWHMPQHKIAWDEHDTGAKWLRCAQFIAAPVSASMSLTNLRVK